MLRRRRGTRRLTIFNNLIISNNNHHHHHHHHHHPHHSKKITIIITVSLILIAPTHTQNKKCPGSHWHFFAAAAALTSTLRTWARGPIFNHKRKVRVSQVGHKNGNIWFIQGLLCLYNLYIYMYIFIYLFYYLSLYLFICLNVLKYAYIR